MPYNQYQEIRNLIWQEEKKYLMKKVAFDLILNDALKIGDYILFSGKKSPYYVDLRQAISDPITLDLIANSLARIIDNEITPRFQAGDFDGGVVAGVASMAEAVRGEYQGTGRVGQKKKRNPLGSLALLLFLGPGLMLLGGGGRRGRYRRGGFWIGGLGGFGGSGGGGFGGGGGGFGGGGASGGW